jgi:hypothetical protein
MIVVAEPENSSRAGRSTLFGYAVIRANFNHDAPSYLDNFNAFVLDVLAGLYPVPGTEAVVGEAIRDTFGFTIPDKVVGHLLKKLAKIRKVTVQEDGSSYQLENSARAGLVSLNESINKFKSQQAELLSKFTDFIAEGHRESLDLISADPASHLHDFIARYAAPLLRRGVADQREAITPWRELQGTEFLVGLFVRHLERNDSATFGYLIEAVKGAILAGVLEMGPGDLRQSLSKLTIVLDTPVLLSALGYQGTIPQQAAEQMLQLARKLGVRLVCFDHTVKEIDGVLDAAIVTLRHPAKTAEGWSAVALYFAGNGAKPADIASAQTTLRSNLENLELKIIPRPGGYQYGLDEKALDALLKKELPTQKESTRLYDLYSISAVHRLRKGSSPDSFERCGYVFVTDNSGLIAVARKVDERHRWPLVMLESQIASLLWVRSPAVAEDLPRQQLLAAVYTGMQPAPHLWMKYVEEIERLEAEGLVNPDEAVLFRSRPEARDILMDVTLGESTRINEKSMEQIVSRVRADISLPYRREVDDAKAARDRAEQEAGSQRLESDRLRQDLQEIRRQLEHERQARDENIKQQAARRSHRIVLSAVVVVVLILCFPVVLKTVDPGAVRHLPAWLAFLSTGVAVILAFLGSFRMFIGGTVLDWLRPVEQRLASHTERRLRASAGLPPKSNGQPET